MTLSTAAAAAATSLSQAVAKRQCIMMHFMMQIGPLEVRTKAHYLLKPLSLLQTLSYFKGK